MSALRKSFVVAAIVAVLTTSAALAQQGGMYLAFVPHATFFSKETRPPKPLDPQVFVHDDAAAAAVGPQGIEHVAGVRPALISQDKKSSALLNAKGTGLGFDLRQWLTPKGDAIVRAQTDGTAKITVSFSGLRPNGHYSLFESHYDQKPVGFTPLDGKGEHNNFIASTNGRAQLVVIAPSMLTKDHAILLVYHSDEKSHGADRGNIGVDAHHQLIAPISGKPAAVPDVQSR